MNISDVYGIWIENHFVKKWIKNFSKSLTAAIIIAAVIICIFIIWGLTSPPSSDPTLNGLRYLMLIAPTIIIITALITQGWYPISIQKKSLPIEVKMNEDGIIWKSVTREISIPWNRLDKENKGSTRDLIRNPEVYILRDIVLEGRVTRRIWWFGWDWRLWDNDMLLAIRIGYGQHKSNLQTPS